MIKLNFQQNTNIRLEKVGALKALWFWLKSAIYFPIVVIWPLIRDLVVLSWTTIVVIMALIWNCMLKILSMIITFSYALIGQSPRLALEEAHDKD